MYSTLLIIKIILNWFLNVPKKNYIIDGCGHLGYRKSNIMHPIYLQSKLNCEVLYDDLAFEVRWAVAGESVVVQLVAKLGKFLFVWFIVKRWGGCFSYVGYIYTMNFLPLSYGNQAQHGVKAHISVRQSNVSLLGSNRTYWFSVPVFDHCSDDMFNFQHNKFLISFFFLVKIVSVTFRRVILLPQSNYAQVTMFALRSSLFSLFSVIMTKFPLRHVQ